MNCFICGAGVMEDSCIKLSDGRAIHWDCFFDYGLKLNPNEDIRVYTFPPPPQPEEPEEP